MTIQAFSLLEVEGVQAELRVRSAASEERLHAPPILRVLCEPFSGPAERTTLDPEALLGQRAKLTLSAEGGDVVLEGVCDAVRLFATGAELTVVHPVADLARAVDHRVFLDADAVAVAQAILGAHELHADVRMAASPAKRRQCVQAWESDLGFVTRLLAEEGAVLSAELAPGSPLAFVEGKSGFQPIAGEARLPWSSGAGAELRAPEHVTAARVERRVAPGKVAVRDYDFEKPALDLSAAAGAGGLVHYAFGSAAHGGAGASRYRDASAGKALAERRLQALRRHALVLEATTTSPRLAVGRTFTLEGAPREDWNAEWLVVELRRALTEPAMGGAGSRGVATNASGHRYEATFRAVPAAGGYRPEVLAAPSMGGLATATVTGASGQEIATDAHGRVTSLLCYDRRGTKDDKSSTALRVLHPPTSGGFMLPRVGWEALVGFLGASGDEPYVLGRLDNGAARPAEGLPGKEVCSNFGTPTTPGGGSSNMFRMNDTAGGEELTVVASSNYDEQTAANKKTFVGGSESRSVGANREVAIDANHGIDVGGAQTVSVGGSRRHTAASGIAVKSASETVIVGGARDFSVGGDQTSLVGGGLTRVVGGSRVLVALAGHNRHASGGATMSIGGSWVEAGAHAALSVAGASNLAASAIGIKCAKYAQSSTALVEEVAARIEKGAAIKLSAGAAMSLSFGETKLRAPTVHVKASSITVSAGGATLTVEPGSVTFKGDFKAGGTIDGKGKATHG